MYRLLRLIFIGTWELPKQPKPCNHKWKEIAAMSNNYKFVRTLQCEHCGELYDHVTKSS